MLHHSFWDIKSAENYIKKLLAEIDTTKNIEFLLVESLSEMRCNEFLGTWESVSEVLLFYLSQLDEKSGYMIGCEDDVDFWDFFSTPTKIANANGTYVSKNHGLTVIHDPEAVCENQFPVIVVKEEFWHKHKTDAEKILEYNEPGIDFTTKISPAIYIELFFSE